PAAFVFFGDFHTHTRHSHGRGTVAQNARAAAAKALELSAITDHGPASLFGVGAQGLQSFREIRREARQASGPGLTVLTGVEANVISFRGHLDIPAEWAGEFDLIIAGLHLSARPRCPRSAAAIWGRHFAGLIHRRFEPSARSANTHALIEAVCAQT